MLSVICFYAAWFTSFKACSLKSSMKWPNRPNLSVDWGVSVAIHFHFPFLFTLLCLQTSSDIRFNSGACYSMLCNTLIILVPSWHCYVDISHLVSIGLGAIWVFWLSDWFWKKYNYPRQIYLKIYEWLFQFIKTLLWFLCREFFQ